MRFFKDKILDTRHVDTSRRVKEKVYNEYGKESAKLRRHSTGMNKSLFIDYMSPNRFSTERINDSIQTLSSVLLLQNADKQLPPIVHENHFNTYQEYQGE